MAAMSAMLMPMSLQRSRSRLAYNPGRSGGEHGQQHADGRILALAVGANSHDFLHQLVGLVFQVKQVPGAGTSVYSLQSRPGAYAADGRGAKPMINASAMI